MNRNNLALALAATLMAATTAHSETIAAWFPSASGGPRGTAYDNAANVPGADETSAGVLWATAQRTGTNVGGNAGAVWSGGTSLTEFSDYDFTSFSLEVAEGSAISIDHFLYYLNCYNTERETENAGTPEEAVTLSTLQFRLRSSLDEFASDLATFTSLPEERADSNNIPISFDLTEVAGLRSVTEPIEFRLYIWEESTVATYNPFIWIDLASGGCLVEGEVLTSVNREVLAAWIPVNAPAEETGEPANSTGVEPAKKILSPAVATTSAMNLNRGGYANRRSVWPAAVNSQGFDEFSYLETTLTPALDSTINITNYVINAFSTYGSTGTAGWAASLRTSLDDFSEDIATASELDVFEIAFDLSDQAQLQNVSEPITLRMYLWDVEPTDGSEYDAFMWADIEGTDFAEFQGLQVIGTTGATSLFPPQIVSAVFEPGTGVIVEAANVVPGRFYDLFVTFDLAEPFTPLEIETQADSSSLTLIDTFADVLIDPKAFYIISEVLPR